MATLAQLEEQKADLENRLNAGDLSAEAALARVDAAIVSRTKKIRHSQQRLAAVKNAVKAGVPVEKAKSAKALSKTRKKEVDKANQPLNRFE